MKIVQVDGIIILVNNTVPSRKDQNFRRHEAQKDRGYEVIYAYIFHHFVLMITLLVIQERHS